MKALYDLFDNQRAFNKAELLAHMDAVHNHAVCTLLAVEKSRAAETQVV